MFLMGKSTISMVIFNSYFDIMRNGLFLMKNAWTLRGNGAGNHGIFPMKRCSLGCPRTFSQPKNRSIYSTKMSSQHGANAGRVRSEGKVVNHY